MNIPGRPGLENGAYRKMGGAARARRSGSGSAQRRGCLRARALSSHLAKLKIGYTSCGFLALLAGVNYLSQGSGILSGLPFPRDGNGTPVSIR